LTQRTFLQFFLLFPGVVLARCSGVCPRACCSGHRSALALPSRSMRRRYSTLLLDHTACRSARVSGLALVSAASDGLGACAADWPAQSNKGPARTV